MSLNEITNFNQLYIRLKIERYIMYLLKSSVSFFKRSLKNYRTGRSSIVYIFSRLAQVEKWTKTNGFYQSCTCTLRFCRAYLILHDEPINTRLVERVLISQGHSFWHSWHQRNSNVIITNANCDTHKITVVLALPAQYLLSLKNGFVFCW